MLKNSSTAIQVRQSAALWLVRLRSLALIGQLGILLACAWWDIALPWVPLISIVSALAVTNILLQARWRSSTVSADTIAVILVLDILLFSAVLFWTGGVHNPLSILYIVHVAMAAVILGARWTLFTALLSTLCFAALFFFFVPFPLFQNHHAHSSVHLYGMWVGYVLTAAMVTYFLTKVTAALAAERDEVHRLRLLALKHEQLAALVAFAAGAAHELSTPLSTIALAVDDLRASELNSEARTELQLIDTEIQRCKNILSQLNFQAGETLGEMPKHVTADELYEHVRSALSPERRSRLLLEPHAADRLSLPVTAVSQALVALVNNALDASDPEQSALLKIEAGGSMYSFSVQDQGSGMPAEALSHFGEPFYTTKQSGSGMGLGVFLCKLLAERLHGRLEVKSSCGKGTEVQLKISAAQEMLRA